MLLDLLPFLFYLLEKNLLVLLFSYLDNPLVDFLFHLRHIVHVYLFDELALIYVQHHEMNMLIVVQIENYASLIPYACHHYTLHHLTYVFDHPRVMPTLMLRILMILFPLFFPKLLSPFLLIFISTTIKKFYNFKFFIYME